MKPHEQRVVTEKEELYDKIQKLSDFMHGDIYASLDDVNKGLMMVQIVAMRNYYDALTRRIELFQST